MDINSAEEQSQRVRRAVEQLEASSPAPLTPVSLSSKHQTSLSLPHHQTLQTLPVVEEEHLQPVESAVAHIEAALTDIGNPSSILRSKPTMAHSTDCAKSQPSIAHSPSHSTAVAVSGAQSETIHQETHVSTCNTHPFDLTTHTSVSPELSDRQASQHAELLTSSVRNEQDISQSHSSAHAEFPEQYSCENGQAISDKIPVVSANSHIDSTLIVSSSSLSNDKSIDSIPTVKEAFTPPRTTEVASTFTPKDTICDVLSSPVTPSAASEQARAAGMPSQTGLEPSSSPATYADIPFPQLDDLHNPSTNCDPVTSTALFEAADFVQNDHSTDVREYIHVTSGSHMTEQQGDNVTLENTGSHPTQNPQQSSSNVASESVLNRSTSLSRSEYHFVEKSSNSSLAGPDASSHRRVLPSTKATAAAAAAITATKNVSGTLRGSHYVSRQDNSGWDDRCVKPSPGQRLTSQKATQSPAHEDPSPGIRIKHDGDRDDRSVRSRSTLFSSIFQDAMHGYSRSVGRLERSRRSVSLLSMPEEADIEVFDAAPEELQSTILRQHANRSINMPVDKQLSCAIASPGMAERRPSAPFHYLSRARLPPPHVTTPQPFQLPGDKFYERAIANIESKRRAAELMELAPRLYKARAMPDFSHDPRKVRHR